ncbi:TetR/AcrR family transcriptional regulator [Pontibacter cellulosilyticus]|uniref:TetR/AcrR family transcriptional regulator n=1 Tax=Pontibacter cellulosilyticus TaxID=1720253 RepID=A0A923SH65_9BACT|nr:TetR/AcrR family transcriptional regulator [Pontibacter cellulosilyticus]MBC5991358.1 TetR/AcrR family transcriptional regulator [Pontibacter cellulosilyticus]
MHVKEQIIKKAGQLFFKKGYVGVLMSDIAKEMGMSKKTLYQHFSGKEELVLEVIRAFQNEMQTTVEQLIKDTSISFPDKASQIFKYVATRLNGINPQFIEDIKQNSPKSWKLVQDYKADAAYLRFNSLLKEGAKLGYIRDDINRPLAVMLYASALDTIVNPSFMRQIPAQLTNDLPYSPEAIFDGIVTIIFEGILNGKEH